MKTPKYMYESLEQIAESKLLTPERMAEVIAGVAARQVPLLTHQGKPVKNGVGVIMGDGEIHFFILNPGEKYNVEYMERTILPMVLTPEECELIQKEGSNAHSRQRDSQLFEKAEKINEDDWKDGDIFYGDEHYPDISSLEDALDGEEMPEFVWAADKRITAQYFDVLNGLESCIESHGWEDMDTDDFSGVEELIAAGKAFVEKNMDVVSYWADETRAIILNKRNTETE